ncbi:restriction endonuclease subunit S [Vibrio ouci]|uniref:Restriction endonuclease subunit S n=1 Tax=Vibrio ouci TaxID=2499078 RepID=A0A4Y8WJL9_9VIBR|nr:restriction endonuclease subunit S [Vibrio ouci]TFH92856.1 restriction endonuclease subunit S [Vibrio ouci]
MGSEWKEFTLEEIASKEKSALATGPFGSAISSKFFQEDGVPVIRGGNLSADTSNRMSDEGLVFVSEDKAIEFKRSVVKAGDLIFTCWGTINQVGLLDESRKFEQYIISNKQMKVTLDSNKADPLFVYYVFSSPKKQSEILKNGIGAAVPGFNLGQLREHKLWLPSVSEQQKISSFLDCFDKKISLNGQINQTLEQMAQTLFKSWFVDFDPVIDNALDADNPIPEVFETRVERRKAVRESADFKPLPDNVRQLFPREFEESELSWVPKGWVTVSLSEITTELRRGISPKYVEEGGVRVINQKCIRHHDINFDLCRRNNPELRKIAGREIEVGDVLVNSTGVGTLGRVAQVTQLEEVTVVDSHVTVVRSNGEKCLKYTFGQLMLSNEKRIEALGEGSTGQTELSRKILSEQKVVLPPKHISQVIEPMFSSYADKRVALNRDINILTKLRDTLLPKLISGELRLDSPEVEQAKALVE